MMKKRWCGALLALALVLTLLPTAAFAEGSTAPADITGSGASNDPYLIYTATGLKTFRDKVNGQNGQTKQTDAHAKLMNDIVLNDGTFDENGSYTKGASGKDAEQWTPIGNLNQKYSGKFDGNGKTIKGLYVKGQQYAGLFGYTANAIIQNVTVDGYVNGYAQGDDESPSCAGGIVGRQWGGEIKNCRNNGAVCGSAYYVGGIAGYTFSNREINNCLNTGMVSSSRDGSRNIGGIIGFLFSSTLNDCCNTGTVTDVRKSGDLGDTGGIIGWSSKSTINNCYNTGTVTNSEVSGITGGIVGRQFDGEVKNCYYLTNTAENAVMLSLGSANQSNVTDKNKAAFANGDVLALLKQNDTTNAWADECGYLAAAGMTLPLLSWQQADDHTCTPENASHWESDTSGHWQVCSCGKYINRNVHSGGTATCTTQAVCGTCGRAYGTYHPNLTHFDAKAATTSAEGNIEYWHCPDCGKYFKDAAATQETTLADTVIARLPGSIPYYPPSYAVTVEKAEHGSVTVSPKSAAAGATVTVTVTPDEGYTLETLTVTDRNGNELTLTDKGGGKYTFTMPSGSVTVRATFMDDNTMLNFFVDVKPGDYYYDAVLWAAQKGITSGTDAAHFSPNLPCTRGQIVTFLWRAAGSPVVNYAMDMTDVPEGSYYAEAVRWALSLGITTGTGADAFSPDAPCTRAQAVTFLARARNAKASGGMAVREFEDFDRIPAYAVDAIQWALENNVTTGTGDGNFAPDAPCTRAQIVTFLYRAFS